RRAPSSPGGSSGGRDGATFAIRGEATRARHFRTIAFDNARCRRARSALCSSAESAPGGAVREIPMPERVSRRMILMGCAGVAVWACGDDDGDQGGAGGDAGGSAGGSGPTTTGPSGTGGQNVGGQGG